jgi:hypothetical protein
MLTFDAGKLAAAMSSLGEIYRVMSGLDGEASIPWGRRDGYRSRVTEISDYCKEAGFPLADIPLTTIIVGLRQPEIHSGVYVRRPLRRHAKAA